MRKDIRASVPISLSLELGMVEKIDNLRGDVTRSRFITRLIEKMFKEHPEEIEEYVNKQGIRL